MKYLNTICDDEIVGIEDREACIASALSVLNILFSANEETSNKLIKGNMGHHGHDRMVVGFKTTCAISAYHH